MIGWTEELISLLVNSTINYQEETTQKTIPGSNWSPRLCKTCKDKEPPIKPKLKKKKTTSPWDGGAGMKIRGYNPQPPPSSVNILPLHLCVPPDLLAKEAQATHLSACSPSESLFPLKYILTLLSCRGKKKNKELKGFISWWKIIPASLTGILSFPTQPPNELNGLLILSTCGRTC